MTAEARFTLQTALAGLDIQVRIRGELDVTAAPELARALDSLRGSGRGGLVLHLNEVEFIDCACARVIARAASTWPLPGRAVIQAASPAVRPGVPGDQPGRHGRDGQARGAASAPERSHPRTRRACPPGNTPGWAGEGMTPDPYQASRGGDQDNGSGLGPGQLAAVLRAPVADLYRARELGLLPGPGPAGRPLPRPRSRATGRRPRPQWPPPGSSAPPAAPSC